MNFLDIDEIYNEALKQDLPEELYNYEEICLMDLNSEFENYFKDTYYIEVVLSHNVLSLVTLHNGKNYILSTFDKYNLQKPNLSLLKYISKKYNQSRKSKIELFNKKVKKAKLFEVVVFEKLKKYLIEKGYTFLEGKNYLGTTNNYFQKGEETIIFEYRNKKYFKGVPELKYIIVSNYFNRQSNFKEIINLYDTKKEFDFLGV